MGDYMYRTIARAQAPRPGLSLSKPRARWALLTPYYRLLPAVIEIDHEMFQVLCAMTGGTGGRDASAESRAVRSVPYSGGRLVA